jgi:hypothetical protein
MSPPDEFNVFFIGDQIAALVGLMALTMFIHGYGMVTTLVTATSFDQWLIDRNLKHYGSAVLILAALMIVSVHFLEVVVWALFFYVTGAIKNLSDAFYFTLLEYVTLGSSYNLPFRWRNLEGAIAMAGLLTFAWSTSVLMTLVARVQDDMIERRRRAKAQRKNGEHARHDT